MWIARQGRVAKAGLPDRLTHDQAQLWPFFLVVRLACDLHANNRASHCQFGRNALFALAERTCREFGGIIDSAIGTREAISDCSAVHGWVYRPAQLCLLNHKFVVHVRFSCCLLLG